jgi:hypothetical protein
MISFLLTYWGLYSFGAPCGVNGFLEKVLGKKKRELMIADVRLLIGNICRLRRVWGCGASEKCTRAGEILVVSGAKSTKRGDGREGPTADGHGAIGWTRCSVEQEKISQKLGRRG